MVKFLRLYCCLATFLILSFSSVQLEAQTFKGALEEFHSSVLTQHFSEFQVFQLNSKALDTYVKSNAEAPVQLIVGDHQWQLALTLNPIVSANYFLQVSTDQGIEKSFPKLDIAYKGYELNGGGKLRLTLHDEFLYGYVEEGLERYYIEPLWYFEPFASRDLFVVYPKSAVKEPLEHGCGVTQEQEELQHLEEKFENEVAAGAEFGDCYELELAIASDESMCDKYGGAGGVENHNIGVINSVEGDYTGNFTHDLDFIIVTQFVSCGPDPWTASLAAGTLLDDFANWGNGGNFGANFDIGELWTDRDFTGGTVGIAFLNGVCNSVKYHCLQDFTGDQDLLRCMTSHEIGHNFSSQHDGGCPPGDFIMCPFVSNSTEWSDQSKNSINNYMQVKINSGCLSTCGPPPPPLVAGFGWLPQIGCEDQEVNFTDLSTGNITSWAWTFQGGTPATSTAQNPTVIWATPGMKNISLTITGQGGSNTLSQTIEILPQPVANFTFSVNGLIVTFDNTSVNADAYEWDFGDGNFSNEEDPIHEYIEAGIYTVVLTASNACTSVTKTYSVNTAPTADFSASPTSGCAELTVMMENLSSSNAVSFVWTFPGGSPTTATQMNPIVSYNLAGTFPITLKAINTSGSHIFTRTNYITVNTAPAANFSSSVNGSIVTFTNLSIGTGTYVWNFGDGDTSHLKNPIHTYASPGTYEVILTATNECGTSTKSRTVEIVSVMPPTVAFSANPSTGCAPLTVNFVNATTGAVSYEWSFPGGTPSTSTATSPTVVYDSAGVYSAILTATNTIGSTSDTITVTVNTIPDPAFNYTVSNDTVITFTNTSSGATSFIWDFGDGSTSTDESPIHEYPAHDSIYIYTVVLQSENSCGTVNDTQFISIVTDPNASFTATPTTGCAPLTVQFTNGSTPNATSFLWRFPGGTPDTSIVKNPVVVYATAGTYPVTLIAINTSGRDTSTRTDYVVVNTTPTASFTTAPNGLTVAFTNTTAGGVTYSWDFGDGGTSTDVNPSHTYATDGTYTVILSATNGCGTVTKPQAITVTSAPTAGFTASVSAGCAPLAVQFSNTSSPNAATFEWQFPGGNPSSSTVQNPPSVEYGVPGTYTVTLTVSNSAGTNTFTQNITVNGGPTANYSASVAGLSATFTNTSINGTSYSWDFGDGGSSSDANPVHDYLADGTYAVVLTATNDCGTNTFTQNVLITTAPSAGFSLSTTNGCVGMTVNFTDISSGDPVSWAWEFPGGTPTSSTLQNPTVQYLTPGVYDATLVVTSVGGSTSSFTQPNIVTVNGAPSVGFTSVISGASANFNNTSANATTYVWNFGDGSTSTEQNPTHVYANDGQYTVILSATNNCGTSIFEQTVVIATPPTAGFNTSFASGCAPFTVQFSNTSSTNATTLSWDFPGGDPTSASSENPSVTWNTAGVYTVTLTASNATGSSTSTTTITVLEAATAGFTYQIGGLTAVFNNISTGGASYAWNFGDGNTSTEQNPNHTYAEVGIYLVTLSTTNECGTVTVTQTVIVEGSAPVPSIMASSPSGCAPFTVNFTDQSAGEPNAWAWVFNGGSPAVSNDQNPTVSYNAAGTYDVKLEVTNAFGVSSEVFVGFITVQVAPTANYTFTANQTTVSFTSTSQNATAYAWNFGDGNTSTEQNPVHTYTNPGTYTVSLSTTNNCGTAIIEQTVVITSGTGEANWIEGFRLYPNPNTGVFTVEMNGLPQNEVEFTLFNALGQQIKRETANFQSGALLQSFDYGNLAAGVYALRVQAAGQAMYVKVTINR